MKILKVITIFVVLLLTASAASAAYDGHNWKHHKHHPHYKPCKDCGKSDNTCSGGEDTCSGRNCNTTVPPVTPSDTTVHRDSQIHSPPVTPSDATVPPVTPSDTTVPPVTPSDTTVPPVTPSDTSGTTTIKLCKDRVCTVGGNGQVLTLTNYNDATNPTYDQLLTFLKSNKVDEKPYTSTYVCSDFAKALHDSAEKAGIKAGWVGAEGANHAFNVFETTDYGTVYIDCTGIPRGGTLQDKQLNVEVGESLTGKYLFRSGSVSMPGAVQSLLVYW